MHLSKYLQFLQESPISLFNNLSKGDAERARRIITKTILATDMASHFTLSDQMKQKVEAVKAKKEGVETPLTEYLELR